MTPSQEQDVLKGLYDRLFQAITYTPENGAASLDAATTFIQFSKGEALNPADFLDARSPSNPGGSKPAAYNFSTMVDAVPLVEADYTPSANKVSDAYRQIIFGANSQVSTDTAQLTQYNNARALLYDANGSPTSLFSSYRVKQKAYDDAVRNYGLAALTYDMNDPQQSAQWEIEAPGLQSDIDWALDDWIASGKAQVEGALATMQSSINHAVANVIQNDQSTYNGLLINGVKPGDSIKWHLSYALPGNWATDDGALNFSHLNFSSSNLTVSSDSTFTSYGGGLSWSGGLWSVGGSFAHDEGSTHYTMNADNFELNAEIALVRIYRPWLNDLIFRMNNWTMDGMNPGDISNGQLAANESGFLPLIPTAFVVARNIAITMELSAEEQSHYESSTSGSVSVGWGPFRIGGHYSHSESSDWFSSSYSNGTLSIPGMQIVAWVSEIVPFAPPSS